MFYLITAAAAAVQCNKYQLLLLATNWDDLEEWARIKEEEKEEREALLQASSGFRDTKAASDKNIKGRGFPGKACT